MRPSRPTAATATTTTDWDHDRPDAVSGDACASASASSRRMTSRSKTIDKARADRQAQAGSARFLRPARKGLSSCRTSIRASWSAWCCSAAWISRWMDHIDAMDRAARRHRPARLWPTRTPSPNTRLKAMTCSTRWCTSSAKTPSAACIRPASIFRSSAEKSPSRQETNLEQAKAAGGPSGPKRVQKQVGRNDPCPCGSGKKYKNCCGKDKD